MFVHPFWFGVLTTVIVEIVACIVFAIVQGVKGDKEE